MTDEQPAEAPAPAEPLEPAAPAAASSAPWYADPFFMAGVATSVAIVVWLAIRPKRECADCRKHREAAEQLDAAGIPEPAVRTPATPVVTPGTPGVAPVPESYDDTAARVAAEMAAAAELPVVARGITPAEAPSLPTLPQPGAPGVGGPVGLIVPAGDGPRCTIVEWCALPDSHPGAHLAAARPAMTGEELAAAAAASAVQ